MKAPAARDHAVRLLFFLAVVLGAFGGAARAHADPSDFARDVQAAVSGSGHAASGILDPEYTSAWDAFGTSAVISGNASASEISDAVLSDVTADASRQIGYERTEARYLEAIHSTPEKVLAAEESDGVDLLPQDAIDPFPSADANPDADYSSTDDLQSVSADMHNDTSAAAESSDLSAGSSDKEDLSDALAPAEGDWAPGDITIFQAIIDTAPVSDASAASGDAAGDSSASAPDQSAPSGTQ